MKYRAAGLALAIAACAAPAETEAEPPAPAEASPDLRAERLSIDELLARARASSRAAALAAEVPVTEARVGTAQMLPDPRVTVGLAQLDVSGQGAPVGTTVGVAVPVELGGVRSRRVALARADVALSRAEVEEALAGLELAAALAYVDAQEAEANHALVLEALRVATSLAELDARRFEARELGEADALRTALERDRLLAELRASEGAVRASALRLGAFVAPDAGRVAPILPAEALSSGAGAEALDALVARALEERPLLRAFAAQVARSEASVDVARRERIADVEVGASMTHYAGTDEPQFRQRSNDVVALTLSMPVPFSNRRNGAVAEARARVARDASGYEAAKTQVVGEVRAAYAALEAARQRAAVFSGRELERLGRFVDRAEREYAAGESTLLARLDAERARSEIRRANVAALAELARARLRLARAVGRVNGARGR